LNPKLLAGASTVFYAVVLSLSLPAYIDFMGASLGNFLLLFWPFLFIDLPRYLLPDILVWARERLRRPEEWNLANRAEPLVSIIIPAHDEVDTIETTIESILEADYPNKEIIVVDDGSTDGTHLKVERFVAMHGIVLVRKERGGKAAAINTGLTMTHGPIVVTVDSDTTIARDSIRRIVRYFDNQNLSAIACNLRVRNTRDGLIPTIQDCEYLVSIGMGKRFLSWVRALFVVSGAFGAFRRNVLEEVGGWDPGIGDDSNITLKVRKTRGQVIFAPEIVALTNVPRTLPSLYKQRKRWEKSFVRNRLKKHPDILRMDKFGSRISISILGEFFFRVVLLFVFYYYLTWVILFQPLSNFLLVLGFSYLMYTGLNLISLVCAASISEFSADWRKVIYAWLMFPYRVFLRFPRTIAFLEEFTGWHYRHPFYPDLVWESAPVWTFSKRTALFLVLYGGILVLFISRVYSGLVSMVR